MTPSIDWNEIDTVLLDMDGTLLDLNFDNYFWQELLPKHWGEQQGISAEKAFQQLKDWYEKEKGTLPWYCLDYWTERLGFDVFSLTSQAAHLIQKRPHAEAFLKRLADGDFQVVMVTNAHQDLVEFKMQKTGIDIYFDHIISSHQIGHAKEEQDFWHQLLEHIHFRKDRTLFIDDNLSVLRSAAKYGIQHIFAIAKPDSQVEAQDTMEFQAIHSFADLLN